MRRARGADRQPRLALDVSYATRTLLAPQLELTGYDSFDDAVVSWQLAFDAVIAAGGDITAGVPKILLVAALVDAPTRTATYDGGDVESQVRARAASALTALGYLTYGRYSPPTPCACWARTPTSTARPSWTSGVAPGTSRTRSRRRERGTRGWTPTWGSCRRSVGRQAGRTVLGSGVRLPFADGTFDVCFSSNVLEHVGDPWGMAEEMVRVTRPGGTTVISYTVWLGPWGGHETSPWHYLGGARARARYRRVHGHEPKNRFGESLFAVGVAPACAGPPGNAVPSGSPRTRATTRPGRGGCCAFPSCASS